MGMGHPSVDLQGSSQGQSGGSLSSLEQYPTLPIHSGQNDSSILLETVPPDSAADMPLPLSLNPPGQESNFQ
jgi:hypothetical protein